MQPRRDSLFWAGSPNEKGQTPVFVKSATLGDRRGSGGYRLRYRGKLRLRIAYGVEHLPFFHLKLLRTQQGPGLVIVTDLMELNFVRNSRREPSAPDDANFAPAQRKLWNVQGEPNKIINVRRSHGILRECCITKYSP